MATCNVTLCILFIINKVNKQGHPLVVKSVAVKFLGHVSYTHILKQRKYESMPGREEGLNFFVGTQYLGLQIHFYTVVNLWNVKKKNNVERSQPRQFWNLPDYLHRIRLAIKKGKLK